MTTVECPMIDCRWNVSKECGKKDISLKWRLAGDFGKGNIVMLECLNLELPGGGNEG